MDLGRAIEQARDAAATGDRLGLIGGLRKLAEWLRSVDLSTIEALLDALLGGLGVASTLDASVEAACAEAAGVAAAWDGTGAIPPPAKTEAAVTDVLRVLRKLLALLGALGITIPGLPGISSAQAPESAPEQAPDAT